MIRILITGLLCFPLLLAGCAAKQVSPQMKDQVTSVFSLIKKKDFENAKKTTKELYISTKGQKYQLEDGTDLYALTTWLLGSLYYSEKNYEKSLAMWSDFISHYNTIHPSSRVQKNELFRCLQDAIAFSGACYLKLGKTENARECFSFLPVSDGRDHRTPKAKELGQRLGLKYSPAKKGVPYIIDSYCRSLTSSPKGLLAPALPDIIFEYAKIGVVSSECLASVQNLTK